MVEPAKLAAGDALLLAPAPMPAPAELLDGLAATLVLGELLELMPVLVPVAPVLLPLTPDVPVVLEPVLTGAVPVLVPLVEVLPTPTQGATVAVVAEPAVMAAPATVQFRGTICSMISTKLSGLALLPDVVVVVVVDVLPVEVALLAEGRAEVRPLVPAAALPDGEAPLVELTPLAAGDALPAELTPVAPAGLLLDVVRVLVVVVELPGVALASRISMNTTCSPLVEMLMKLPASTCSAELPDALEPALVEVEVPVLLEADGVVNAPVHWFCIRTDW